VIFFLFEHSRLTKLEKSEGQKIQEINQGERVGSISVIFDNLGEQRQERKLGIQKHELFKIPP
jgi:hypothetical protein